jgi:hypothetical protein
MTGQFEMKFVLSVAEQETMNWFERTVEGESGSGQSADSGQDIRYTVPVAVELKSFAGALGKDSQ